MASALHSRVFSASSTRSISDAAAEVKQIPSHFQGLRVSPSGGIGEKRNTMNAAFYSNVRNSLSVPKSEQRKGNITMMPIGTPSVPYRTPGEGGWQWVDIWNVLYRERIIFMGQYIDEEFGNQVLATMLYLDSTQSDKPLWLYFNCPGGDLTPSLAIHDTIGCIKSPVGTLALGYCYNLATLLLMSGEKDKRMGMPLTRIAMQSPAGAARGYADDIQNEAKELSRVRGYVMNEVSKKTGQPLEKVNKDFSRIMRFSSEEAVEYGIIDRIVRPKRVKPDLTTMRQQQQEAEAAAAAGKGV